MGGFRVDFRVEIDIRWCSFSRTSSATVVWITPMFPFNPPPKARASKATVKLFANPKINMLRRVPRSPINKTGLRPIRSEILPHIMPVENSARAKAEVTMPA